MQQINVNCSTCKQNLNTILNCSDCTWSKAALLILSSDELEKYISIHQSNGYTVNEAQQEIDKLQEQLKNTEQKSKTLLNQKKDRSIKLQELQKELLSLNNEVHRQFAQADFLDENQIEAHTLAKIEAVSTKDAFIKKPILSLDVNCRVKVMTNDTIQISFDKEQKVFPNLMIMLQKPDSQTLATTKYTKYIFNIPSLSIQNIGTQNNWNIWNIDINFVKNKPGILPEVYLINLIGFHKKNNNFRYVSDSKLLTITI